MSLRQLARDQSCVRCGAEDGTIVLCHYTGYRRHAYGGGFGVKSSDAVGAYLCAACHRHMDTESRSKSRAVEHSEEFLHYCALTWMRLARKLI